MIIKSNHVTALRWITNIIQSKNIPFQIAGGLAAIIYGAKRELADIDIDIPEEAFSLILSEVKPYIILGPTHFKTDSWDIYLLTLNYQGQEIDLGGAYETKIFNTALQKWQPLIANFDTAIMKNIAGITIPVIAIEELIAYKTILNREVDQIDIIQISCNEGK